MDGAFAHEAGREVAAAFEEDRADTFGLGAAEEFADADAQAVAAAPDGGAGGDMRAGIAAGGDDDDGADVQRGHQLGGERRAGVRVGDDAERLAGGQRDGAGREQRVVGEDRADTDEDGVMGSAHLVGPGARGAGGDPLAGAIGERDAAVERGRKLEGDADAGHASPASSSSSAAFSMNWAKSLGSLKSR